MIKGCRIILVLWLGLVAAPICTAEPETYLRIDFRGREYAVPDMALTYVPLRGRVEQHVSLWLDPSKHDSLTAIPRGDLIWLARFDEGRLPEVGIQSKPAFTFIFEEDKEFLTSGSQANIALILTAVNDGFVEGNFTGTNIVYVGSEESVGGREYSETEVVSGSLRARLHLAFPELDEK